MKRIVIIGGGITGLAAAHRLLERSAELTRPIEILLLEATSRLGGVIHTESRAGFLLERGPDSFISEKPEAINLARRLGIDSHLIETNKENRRSFIVRKGRLRAVPEGFQLLAPSKLWPFITSDIFSLGGKARMAADLLLPRRRVNGNDDESLAHFVRRRLGSEALARMAQPMVGGIYTADPEKLSLRATFPRFLDMETSHRSIILALIKGSVGSGTSGARYSLFLSFDRGMQVLVDALEKRFLDSQLPVADLQTSCAARTNTTVDSLTLDRSANGLFWKLKAGNEEIAADAVCLALPTHASAKLLNDVAPGLASELDAISYASTATINLAYRREDIPHRLDGFGFVVPYIEKRSLLACSFSSIKFSGRAPNDCVLLRAFVGGALQPEMFFLQDSQMVARVRSDLHDLIGVEKAPMFAEVSRWARSMPQYEIGHLGRVQRIEDELQRLRGLRVAGNAFSGAGIPDCIRSGETVANELIESLIIDSAGNLK